MDKLLQRQTEKHYPSADNDQQLANAFAEFFTAEIERISEGLVLRKSGFVDSPGLAEPACLSRLSEFDLISDEDVLQLIRGSITKPCNHNANLRLGCYPGFQNGNQSVAVDLSLDLCQRILRSLRSSRH